MFPVSFVLIGSQMLINMYVAQRQTIASPRFIVDSRALRWSRVSPM